MLNPAFARFAQTCGFQVDPCRAGTGQDKGKVERQVRTDRGAFADLFGQEWPAFEPLQAALDRRSHELHARRRCPATGTMVAAALAVERRRLQPLPAMHEPFDVVVARRVSRDALVSFEGRRYSVPFAWVGRTVEVLGTAGHVVIAGDGQVLTRHPRHTARRLVLDPTHYDGPSTARVLAPPPVGRRGRLQLAALAGLPTPAALTRPLTAYVALVEEACR